MLVISGERQGKDSMSISNGMFVKREGDTLVVSPSSLDFEFLGNLVNSVRCDETPFLLFDFPRDVSFDFSGEFFGILKLFADSNLIVISFFDGSIGDGAIELMLASDLVFATKRSTVTISKFSDLEDTLLYYAMRYFGWVRFKELLFVGRLSVDKLSNYVNKIYENKDEFRNDLIRIKNEILSLSALGVVATKKIISLTYDMDFESSLLVEKDIFGYVFSKEDAKKGLKSFLDREKPKFERRLCDGV